MPSACQALGIPETYDEELGNGVAIRFHLIPGGRFTMGSPEGKGVSDERPQRKVTLQPFYLAETELTLLRRQRLRPVRHARQCLGVGTGLLERRL